MCLSRLVLFSLHRGSKLISALVKLLKGVVMFFSALEKEYLKYTWPFFSGSNIWPYLPPPKRFRYPRMFGLLCFFL
jgi:hypothetical protein